MSERPKDLMQKLVSLCKRKGFIYQSSEIYGGINSCYDYGPLGVELRKNIKELWWRAMVYERDDIEGIDASILMHPRVWEASGHVDGFTDPMVDCRETKARYREDQIEVYVPKSGEGLMFAFPEGQPETIKNKLKKAKADPSDYERVLLTEVDTSNYNNIVAPDTKTPGTLTEPRLFNLMFKTFMGPVESDANVVFMRPETAQGIYVNFHNVREAARQKLPFGIAQIGKAFRNEITPGNFIFRMREFEQMEMQYFVKPGTDEEFFEKWKAERLEWYDRVGINKSRLRFHEHGPNELAHYAKAAFDIEYEFPFGWSELEGIHNRTDFDLARHQEFSKKNMKYHDVVTNEKYLPYVVETSTGLDRNMLVALADAYEEEEERVVMRFSPVLAPVKAAIFPLVKKDGLAEVAKDITASLRKQFRVFYDESGAVGRRYRRQDEVGTPYCFTIDYDTMEDGTVTVRERDTMAQERISKDQIMNYLVDRVL